MIRERADVAILGAGFAGSVLAMVLRRLGRSVLLIERGSHPRFAVGESSTPLANLVLESLADELRPAAAGPAGGIRAVAARLPPSGVRRQARLHLLPARRGPAVSAAPDRANELLVGANPSDDAADTHWFREHVDHFLLTEAQSLGASYHDRTEIDERWRAGRETGRSPAGARARRWKSPPRS